MRILKKKFLFSLASEKNFLLDKAGYGYKGYDFLYFRLSEFERGSIRDVASKLFRVGAVDKIVKNGESQYRLTSVGREKLLNNISIYRGQNKVWDRIWRVVTLFDIGDKSREIKRNLLNLGYKRVSRGVYITPISVSEETKELFWEKTWTNKAYVIASRRLIVGDDRQLARELWGLGKIDDDYGVFIKKAKRLLKMARRNKVLLMQSKGGFKSIFDGFFRLIMNDPGIPKKLLPPEWQAEKAFDLFNRLVVLAHDANV